MHRERERRREQADKSVVIDIINKIWDFTGKILAREEEEKKWWRNDDDDDDVLLRLVSILLNLDFTKCYGNFLIFPDLSILISYK